MFNAASKLYFTLAGLAVVVGFAYVIGTSDRVGFTNLVLAGAAAVGLGVAAYVFVPREPLAVALDEAAEPRPADTTDTAGASTWPIWGALSLGLVAAGAATESSLILLGVIVGLVAVFAWFGQVWREHPSWTQAMTDRINDRFVVPIGLPGTIFLLAGAGVVALSRLFLAVSAEAAPVIGIVIAFALLGAFWMIATKNIGRSAITTLATVGVGLLLASGVAGALKGEREFHSGEGEAAFTIAAEGVEFDKDQLDFPAATAVTLVFENLEAIPHNVALYEAKGGEVIFQGEVLNTEGKVEYEFETPGAGSYYFQCDVHPDQMNGTANVSEDASEGTPGEHDEEGSEEA